MGLAGGEEKESSITGKQPQIDLEFFLEADDLGGRGRGWLKQHMGWIEYTLEYNIQFFRNFLIITCGVVDKNVKNCPFTHQLLVNYLTYIYIQCIIACSKKSFVCMRKKCTKKKKQKKQQRKLSDPEILKSHFLFTHIYQHWLQQNLHKHI